MISKMMIVVVKMSAMQSVVGCKEVIKPKLNWLFVMNDPINSNDSY